MGTLTANNYLGLWNGPVDHEASSVINAVARMVSDTEISIGDALYIREPEDGELLPAVNWINNPSQAARFYGIAVGGDLDGTYGEVGEEVNKDSDANVDIVARTGDGVRVCTQGRCIARVRTEGAAFEAIAIGDLLTPVVGANSEANMVKALQMNDNIVARALQPAAKDVGFNTVQYIAVDVQREDTIP